MTPTPLQFGAGALGVGAEQRRLHAVGLRERHADRVEQSGARRRVAPSRASRSGSGRPTPLRPGPAPSRGSVRLSPQPTAFFTSAPIFASSAAVNSFSAKATGHRAPSSRFAASLKPNVPYLVLNFCALWKKQTTLPSLAYAGIPYQSLGERAGALALMMAWSRLAMTRSGFGISAIFASTSLSPSVLSPLGPRRAAAFSSRARSFIAARSSSVNPLDVLPIAVVLLADFCVTFVAVFFSAIARSSSCQLSSWIRIRLPAGSRMAQSRTP